MTISTNESAPGSSTWTIIWLGHSAFRIETGGQILLVDPWLRGNPSFPADRFEEAIRGATHILLTHGHDDHAADAKEIAAATGATVVAMPELIGFLSVENGVPMNKGGTVTLGDPTAGAIVQATMVHATHSSSTTVDGAPVYLGDPAGFVLRSGGEAMYIAGDTDVHADMDLIAELHKPSIGVLPIGGHFTMDASRAAFACHKYFGFRAVVPCHFGTFPVLAPNADAFVAAVAPTHVEVPEVFKAIRL